MEQLTIDHFVVTDFESFANMTDTLGGVEIHVPYDVHDRAQGFRSIAPTTGSPWAGCARCS